MQAPSVVPLPDLRVLRAIEVEVGNASVGDATLEPKLRSPIHRLCAGQPPPNRPPGKAGEAGQAAPHQPSLPHGRPWGHGRAMRQAEGASTGRRGRVPDQPSRPRATDSRARTPPRGGVDQRTAPTYDLFRNIVSRGELRTADARRVHSGARVAYTTASHCRPGCDASSSRCSQQPAQRHRSTRPSSHSPPPPHPSHPRSSMLGMPRLRKKKGRAQRTPHPPHEDGEVELVEDEASDGTWISAKAPHSSCHSGPWEECDRADDVAGHSPGISAKAPHRVRDAAPDEVVHGSSQCTPRHQQSPPTTTTLRRRA